GIGQDDIGGQGTSLGAEAVDDPRAHAWKAGHDAAAEQLVLRRRVDNAVAVAGTEHGEIIDASRRVREQVGNLDAGLAVFLEGAPAAEQASALLNELILRLSELGGARLAV